MSVPKKRRTSGSAGRRRSHHAILKIKLTKCAQCGKAVEMHSACSFCGNYKDRGAITIKERKAKKETK